MRRSPFVFLLRPSLLKQLETVAHCLSQGLDIYIFTTCPLMRRCFVDLLGQELSHKQWVLCHSLSQAEGEKEHQKKEKSFLPLVIVSNEAVEPGQGYVIHELPPVNRIGLSTSCTVARLLQFYNRECLLDNFDANVLRILKNIHRTVGLPALVDAVQQLTFSLSNDLPENQAPEVLKPYLDGRFYRSGNVGEALSPQLLCQTIESLLALSAFPLDYLKSLVSWYVVHKKHQSLKQASHQLGVARSTLQVHLKRAQQLQIERLFNS